MGNQEKSRKTLPTLRRFRRGVSRLCAFIGFLSAALCAKSRGTSDIYSGRFIVHSAVFFSRVSYPLVGLLSHFR